MKLWPFSSVTLTSSLLPPAQSLRSFTKALDILSTQYAAQCQMSASTTALPCTQASRLPFTVNISPVTLQSASFRAVPESAGSWLTRAMQSVICWFSLLV